ncbi:hypothetical protein PSM7751_02199 [Pseudooceanicola marinus]|uniref:Peptidoglycan binding domain protein n=1 Tax=Pseudooceanicola marinus TaxID=396013 RepID=A0A1X6ZBM2_9RHOB|nr:peptidoglycan-binding domain-containing protein [Pseudooceanicola marinus]PJE28260.1 hypothetical protein CVM50_15025 [Pseudooceanicola marinus]SLN47066.1 hypothetical protein PSM7751_02199 [Pseudooceanicola marinus]
MTLCRFVSARFSTLVALSLLPTTGMAQPCVGPAFDQPLPGAENVQRRYADVPSARYPGIWQEGRVAGFTYRLFMDLTAEVNDGSTNPAWQVYLTCDPASGLCDESFDGLAPIAASRTAQVLGRCLLGGLVTAEDFAPSENARPATGLPPGAGVSSDADRPENPAAGLAAAAALEGLRNPDNTAAPVIPEVPEDDRPLAFGETEAPARPQQDTVRLGPNLLPSGQCGLSAIDEGSSPVMTLQRLLQEGDFAPGAADGMMGPRTRQALQRALGDSATGLTVTEAIAALDRALCAEIENAATE